MQISLDGMRQLAADIVSNLSPLSGGAHVVALSGNVGAGKTTLSQQFAQTLGVTESVTSPTFVLMKQYPLAGQRFAQLVHIDAYRIESLDELAPLRFDELLADTTNLMLIEWPEHIADALPQNKTTISLSVPDDAPQDARDVTIAYASTT
ncbi:MAG: hypothetical protein RL150_569 [Candidatus Parcubacteria bacterium]|jgi:tRNA threonylcarbamoyladenosine biosynthesis protein TsaE